MKQRYQKKATYLQKKDNRDKGVIFKNCAPFINCKTELGNAKDIDIVMPMCDLIEYSNTYSKLSRSLCQYQKDELNNNFADSESFKSKIKITGKTPNNGNTQKMLK